MMSAMHTFSTGRHVTLSRVNHLRHYRLEFREAWTTEISINPCVNAADIRTIVAGLDARGAEYRIFPINLTPCATTYR